MSSPPDTPKATPKQEQAPPSINTSKSKRINDEVEAAAAKFKSLQQRLETLLSIAKDHNASMLDFSEKRIKEARQFELLLKNSPLEEITGKTHYGDSTKPPAKDGSPASKKSPKAKADVKKAGREIEADAFAPVVVERIVVEKSDFSDIDPTLGAVNCAAHDLAIQYAEKEKRHILTYIEEWNKAVSSKVQGRMIEYRKLQDNLKHYEKKVKELRDDIAKQEDKSKSVKSKHYDKMDRNEIKLEGAQEAHDAYGETLILLLEEVTDRSWRDAYPLLSMQLKYQASYYADQAKVFANLEGAMKALGKIGEESAAAEGGRLKNIKEKRPEEIYTGEREMVPLPKKKAAAEE